jgi:6-phosphogluconolactonase
MVADLGIDQVKIYHFDEKDEEMLLVDAIRSELESAPRFFRFSKDGKFFYLVHELKNVIDVFTYETGDHQPKIEKIQTIKTTGPKPLTQLTAASALRFSNDETHMFCGNAGDNTVTVYDRDTQTGLLTYLCCLPISGSYPKDICVFPDDKHIASINHETGSITFFTVDYEKGLLIMNGKELKVNEPNSCVIVKVSK